MESRGWHPTCSLARQTENRGRRENAAPRTDNGGQRPTSTRCHRVDMPKSTPAGSRQDRREGVGKVGTFAFDTLLVPTEGREESMVLLQGRTDADAATVASPASPAPKASVAGRGKSRTGTKGTSYGLFWCCGPA